MLECHPLAEPLWQALTSFDPVALRGLLDPEARRWLNLNDRSIGAESMVRLLVFEGAHVPEPSFRLRRGFATAEGFAIVFEMGCSLFGERHVIVCLLVSASATHVLNMEEFLDGAGAQPLIDHLATPLRLAYSSNDL